MSEQIYLTKSKFKKKLTYFKRLLNKFENGYSLKNSLISCGIDSSFQQYQIERKRLSTLAQAVICLYSPCHKKESTQGGLKAASRVSQRKRLFLESERAPVFRVREMARDLGHGA
jgi:hypothetical protein